MNKSQTSSLSRRLGPVFAEAAAQAANAQQGLLHHIHLNFHLHHLRILHLRRVHNPQPLKPSYLFSSSKHYYLPPQYIFIQLVFITYALQPENH